MPLTRHLYKEDEVAASLMLCCLQGRTQEAAFWCLELIDSGLIDQLLLAVRRIWLFGFGPAGSYRWILQFEDAVKGDALDADTLLQWVLELARLGANRRQDCSVAVLMVLTWGGCAAQPDRVNTQEGVATVGAGPLQQYIELAAWQGKTLAAWGALRAFAAEESPEAAWELCARLAERKHRAGTAPVERWMEMVWSLEDVDMLLRLAACLVFACMPTASLASAAQAGWEWRALGAEITSSLESLRGLLGRRARRAFAIHADAIPWLTERGRTLTVYDTNEKELLRLERLTALWGSQCWDELAEEVGGWEAVRDDDTAREAFYDRFFPDDIPDEWTRAERAKSHGGGVLQRGARPDPARWFRNWFGGAPSAVVWEGARLAKKAFESATATEAIHIWKGNEQAPPSMQVWNLRPVQARKIVAPMNERPIQ